MEPKQATTALAVGDDVLVPWGLDLVPGTIVDLYGDRGAERAVVRLESHSINSLTRSLEETLPTTVNVPASQLSHASSTDSGTSGQWVLDQRYERLVTSTLDRLARDLLAAVEHESGPDRGIDLILNLGDRTALIEVKATKPSSRRHAAELLASHISAYPVGASVLIVVPHEVVNAWKGVARDVGADLVEWDGGDDDVLKTKLADLLVA